jgi:hypothetical protein
MDEWIGVKVSSTHAMPIASTSLMAAGVDKKKKKTAQPLARHVQYNAAKKKKKKTKPE